MPTNGTHPVAAPQRPATASKPTTGTKTHPKPAETRVATEATKAWFLSKFTSDEEIQLATQFCIELGWLMPNETLQDLPLRFVPTSTKQFESFKECLGMWIREGKVGNPYLPNVYDEKKPNAAQKTTQAQLDSAEPPGGWQGAAGAPEPEEVEAEESWRTFPMPWGKQAGVNLEDLEKNYLYGLWANYTVETEYQGKAEETGDHRQGRDVQGHAGPRRKAL